MRNTGIRYNSKERMPTVLSEMAELLPPLSEEQLAVLEADLLANGCYGDCFPPSRRAVWMCGPCPQYSWAAAQP